MKQMILAVIKGLLIASGIILLMFSALTLAMNIPALIRMQRMLSGCTEDTNAVIDFIGLPDGTVFASCEDRGGTLHTDVIVMYDFGSRKNISRHYGNTLEVLWNPETDRAVAKKNLSQVRRRTGISAAMILLLTTVTAAFFIRPLSDAEKLQHKRKPEADYSASGSLRCFAYALPTEPNSSIFSLTFALIASKPGASSLRGSKPLPCRSLPASM